MNILQLRIQDPQSPYEPETTQEKFISYLQWPKSSPFYLGSGGGDASGSGVVSVHTKVVKDGEENKEEKEDEDSESG